MSTILQNVRPRRDVCDDVIDCHDGCLEHFDGRYWLYGTAYGQTDGFTAANRYVAYSSPDLQAWTSHGPILAAPPDGVMYRPYVKFHPRRRKYVLWFNWYPTLWNGQYGVAEAEAPGGPYVIVREKAVVNGSAPGDHSLFVDEDDTAYLVYTDIAAGHRIRVERLNADWTDSTGEQSELFEPRHEATAMFRRGRFYYVTFGPNCCFCPEGSGVRVYRADRPLGRYTYLRDINRDADGRIVVPGQQTHIATLHTSDGPQLLWMADLWGSRPDGVKGHDLQYWGPLTFDGDDVLPLRYVEQWQVNLTAVGSGSQTATRSHKVSVAATSA